MMHVAIYAECATPIMRSRSSQTYAEMAKKPAAEEFQMSGRPRHATARHPPPFSAYRSTTYAAAPPLVVMPQSIGE
jgi:hypothetical protein